MRELAARFAGAKSLSTSEPSRRFGHYPGVTRTKPLSLVAAPVPATGDLGLAGRSDDDLMLLSRAGVDGSFAELVRRHQARVLRLAFRYVGDLALAADVAQSTFVKVFHALPQYRARGTFKAYLYRILLNQCRMARRSARVQSRALETLSIARDTDVTAVLMRERRRDLESALAQLSQCLREVVLLRYGADLDYAEIAETLAVPLGTVKRRMFVALAKLRDTLEEP